MQMLDLINRVQMFQIASSKVNQNLLQRKKNPVFNLQFMETFDGQEEDLDKGPQEDYGSILESDVETKANASVVVGDENSTEKAHEESTPQWELAWKVK